VNYTVNATNSTTAKNQTIDEDEIEESETNTTANKTAVKIKTKKINKTISHEIPIDVTKEYHLSSSWKGHEINKSKALLKRFDFNEEKSKNLSEIKNKLESFIYYIRDIKDNPDF
jgi:hypoxia up-regulated 1